nr:MAG TPA: DNA N-6-adenine-methyltransferase [Caudoviricetes sp.]
MNKEVMFSSKTEMWETPQELFEELNNEFHFALDVCATAENAKCEKYYTPEIDGLSQPWNGTVWCNPPYGRQIGKWVFAASVASGVRNATVVMLLPARTDTRWFHDYIYQKERVEIRFIKGRLKFGGSKNGAPFPSMICIFRPYKPNESSIK